MSVRPIWIVGALLLALYLVLRRRSHGRIVTTIGLLLAAGGLLIGFGLVELPNIEHIIVSLGQRLGQWTYLAVGVLAFLETGAFVGLIAPGETAVIVGGLVAGQGEISLLVLIAIVWTCAVLGDLTSYFVGRRLGRAFLVKHGSRVKITETQIEQVEGFFEKRGGMTILIGRFIGLVRALAPFIAGASRMPLAKFIPYDVLGSGAWAVTFSVLGYVFWRSFDQLTTWVSRGLFGFGLFIAGVVAIVFLVRLERNPELRRKTRIRISAQLDRPLLRPVAPHLRAAWRRVGRPAARASEPGARFVWNRFTPGELGLEVTTILAAGVVGLFTFALFASEVGEDYWLVGDRPAFAIADSLRSDLLVDIARVFTELGSFAVVAALVVATTAWALWRRRIAEAVFLPISLVLCWAVVNLAKDGLQRPRPVGALIDVPGFSYPSGHAAYAVGWVACAVVLVRVGGTIAGRFAAVTCAVILAAAIGLSRVYLRVHYLSDVEGGWGLGVAVFALVGLIAIFVGALRKNGRSS